ncbi:MAG: DUF1294 domain-containing protein [Phycisphaeraceae bacterium]
MSALDLWLLILAGDVLVFSVLTLACYAWDKRQATRSGWRVPEKRLHLLSLLGGWPGAYVGRRWLRHKSVKGRFRMMYWLTVVGHNAVVAAVTYLVWRYGSG